MKILRTPDSAFENLKDYPFEPIYTTIQTHDGTDLRIHHIDEGLHLYDVFVNRFRHEFVLLCRLAQKDNLLNSQKHYQEFLKFS